MHFLVGLAGLVLVLAETLEIRHAQAFSGPFYGPAMLLVGLAPVCFTVSSYSFRELLSCLRATALSLSRRSDRARTELYDDLVRFAAEVRQKRLAAALNVAEEAAHPLLRQLAPLVVKQYSAASLEATAATATFCQVSTLRRSEEVLNTLARVSPAAGLIGTVLGMIALLKDLAKFDQLGPALALAMLCTLYGLLLANAVYQPLARGVRSYTTTLIEESKLLTRSLVLIGEGRSVADVRRLFESTGELAETGFETRPGEVSDGG